MSLTLRPYQEEAIAAIEAAAERGVRRPLVQLPTGTGKTVIIAELAKIRPGRTLVIAHREELLGQAKDKLLLADPSAEIGIVKADRDEHAAPIVLASVQTLSRPNRLQRLAPDFSTVIVDEAHHATAESYVRIMKHVGSFADDGTLSPGFTATPERGDGIGLDSVWQEIVYERSILDMIRSRYLCDLRAIQVQLQADFSQLHTRAGDFIEREVEELMHVADAPEHVVAAYQEHAAGRKALAFTPTVALAHEMADCFSAAGIAAEALDATTPTDARKAILARFHTGETMVLWNCAILTEGYDEPSVDCIVIARPTKSRPFYHQMIGRGTRLYPGKKDCLILDVVGAITRHDLMTASTLFGVEPATLSTETVGAVVATLSRMLFQVHFLAERGLCTPTLVVYEEAHNYISRSGRGAYGEARDSVERIAKEGRKFGIGTLVVSQRPSELSETLLSQCNTFLCMRLANNTDKRHIIALLPDSMQMLTNILPSLPRGQLMAIGQASKMPVRIEVTSIDQAERVPNSGDAQFGKHWEAKMDKRKEPDIAKICDYWIRSEKPKQESEAVEERKQDMPNAAIPAAPSERAGEGV
ncbi:MAG: DEAD/DEAH box helicase family protein [Planctomycetes bacterium]|nr:DEAD/DEAH box helicase family protein [Planctomycetota bacterium]